MSSTPTTVTPPSTPIIPLRISEHLNDSWCELRFKSGCSSTCSTKNQLNQSINPEILEKLLNEAQKETNYPSTSISVQSSPKSPQTPIIIPHHYHQHFDDDEHNIDTCTNCKQNAVSSSMGQSNMLSGTVMGNGSGVGGATSILTTLPQICDISASRQEVSLNKDTDWIWYFSRPQMHPPKEWNFVHPNSSKSKYSVRQHELMDNKLLSRDTINKLIISHMASFILGATL